MDACLVSKSGLEPLGYPTVFNGGLQVPALIPGYHFGRTHIWITLVALIGFTWWLSLLDFSHWISLASFGQFSGFQ